MPRLPRTRMQDGELCFLLNGDQTHVTWYQNIGLDAYPTLDATHAQVYAHGNVLCDGTVEAGTTFNNTEEGSTRPPAKWYSRIPRKARPSPVQCRTA